MNSTTFQAVAFDCLHVFFKTEKPYCDHFWDLEYRIHDFSMFITAQSMLETSAFVSNVFVKNLNCFGMKVPAVRKTSYIYNAGTKAPKSEGSTPYAAYLTVMDSVYDLLNWFQFNRCDFTKINSLADYVSFLAKHSYFGIREDQYLKRCEAYFKLLKPTPNA